MRHQRLGVGAWVGGTPFISLSRSGDGLVVLKHEGLQPGGSFFDRIAAHQLAKLGSAPAGVLVEGTTSWTVSVLSLCNARGLPVVVLIGPAASPRLLALIRRLGAQVQRWSSPAERSEFLGHWEAEGYAYLDRNDAEAHLRALEQLADECEHALDQPVTRWVLVDYGVGAQQAARLLSGRLGYEVRVETIEDDGDQERTLEGAAASRRTQVGHREGMLLGPLGAEVVDRAVDVALSTGERVCAVVPEGGHRFLGWW